MINFSPTNNPLSPSDTDLDSDVCARNIRNGTLVMSEINDEDIKLGNFNLPTITLSVILLCILSFALTPAIKSQNNLLAAIVFLSCPIASIFGLVTLVWCFVKRKQFTGENSSKHFREAVIIGVAAFTSPIWLIILSVMIFGFNR